MSNMKTGLCDWGLASFDRKCQIYPIPGPLSICAPEVIIGAQLGAPADVWNLGVTIVEIMERRLLFSGSPQKPKSVEERDERDSKPRFQKRERHYILEQHLHEIVDVFGEFRRGLLEMGYKPFVERVFTGDGRIKVGKPREHETLEKSIQSVHGKDKGELRGNAERNDEGSFE
ncbi:hypothetical protein EJ08DRAFT_652393 [Tothia fuscella]|uniref:Protein kinase domain-containing protein n=1 Tax=Tothia fuscella TaxID=1048955 RepID=A0A9P4TUW3_9PEZI|nr:hypothetical protein EJ08DRAFT_652393 [Tothia fuscella]